MTLTIKLQSNLPDKIALIGDENATLFITNTCEIIDENGKEYTFREYIDLVNSGSRIIRIHYIISDNKKLGAHTVFRYSELCLLYDVCEACDKKIEMAGQLTVATTANTSTNVGGYFQNFIFHTEANSNYWIKVEIKGMQ